MSQKVIYHGRDMLEQGESFVMCKIINSEGSTPRKKGACMLVKENGRTIGTVGGGKIEAETERLAAEVFKTKEKSRVFHFRLDTSEQGIGMACGGDADVLSIGKPLGLEFRCFLDMMRTLAGVGANLRQATGVARVLAAYADHAVAAVGERRGRLLALAGSGADGVDHAQFLHARGDSGHDLGQVLCGLSGLHDQAHLALER